MGRRLSLTLMAVVYGYLLVTLVYLIVSGWSFSDSVRGLCTYCWIPDAWVWPTFAIGGASAPPVAWLWNYREKTKQWEDERERDRRLAEHREYDPYAPQPKEYVDLPEDGSPPILRQEDDGGSDSIPDDDREFGKWVWDKLFKKAPGGVGEAYDRVDEEVIEGDWHRGSLEPEDDD
jgi:hypothetical protein